VRLHSHIFWGMRPQDPKTFPLCSIPGWSLVNPLVYEPLRRKLRQVSDEWFIKPTFVVGDRYHLATDGFWIAVEQPPYVLARRDWRVTECIMNRLERLVQYMRYASKQFTLIPRISRLALAGYELDQPPEPLLPTKGDECYTARYALTTSLTKEDLEVVSQCDLAELPPTYDTMLLGAMQALHSANYGWAIVLSGVAIEHLALAKLRLEMEAKPGVVSEKDRREARLNDLLHRLRVKLSMPSLYCEKPVLYQEALTIYGQRNDILHGNVACDDNDWNTLRLSIRAVQCAVDIVAWFGELGGYESPSGSHAVARSAHYPGRFG